MLVEWPEEIDGKLNFGSFSLITGINGSGKTRLLKALKSGQAKCTPDLAPNEILYFSFDMLPTMDTSPVDVKSIERAGWDLQSQYSNFLQAELQGLRPRGTKLRYPWAVAPKHFYDSKKQSGFLTDTSAFSEEEIQYHSECLRRSANLLNREELSSLRDILLAEEKKLGRPLIAIEKIDFTRTNVFGLTPSGLFEPRIADYFVKYCQANEDFRIRKLKDEEHGHSDNDLIVLSRSQLREEFLCAYGPPPWEILNQAFVEVGVPIRVEFPVVNPGQKFMPAYYHIDNKKQVTLGDLSSGEKQLLALAMCTYHASDKLSRPLARPKLLLLDEVDAPLHPEMAQQYLRIITEIIGKRLDIVVISTTHSPSTVAMAPDNSIYIMGKTIPRLRLATKQQAIQQLLVGIPKLALSYSGRRHVFVESAVDAEIYNALYVLLQERIASERTLSFVHATKKASCGSDVNGGCEIVKKLVRQLSENGAILGLVDWDGHLGEAANVAEDRIHVLAAGERDGLENLLCDPLILAIAVLRDAPQKLRIGMGFAPNDRPADLFEGDPSRLQKLIDSIQDKVLGGSPGDSTMAVTYLAGFRLNLRRDYLLHDDHSLEGKVLKAFDFLREKNKNGDASSEFKLLKKYIVDSILREYPQAIPESLLSTFSKLLE